MAGNRKMEISAGVGLLERALTDAEVGTNWRREHGLELRVRLAQRGPKDHLSNSHPPGSGTGVWGARARCYDLGCSHYGKPPNRF